MKRDVPILVLSFILSLFLTSVYGGREKRYLFVNPDAPITLGFILNVPISLALPSLVFDKFGRGRSLNQQNLVEEEDESPEDLFLDPNYSDSIEKLLIYFSYMDIPNLSCQERLICELAAHPEAYSPASDLILKELSKRHGPIKKLDNSLIWRYMSSAREGFTASTEECGQKYSKCPTPAYRILNMPVLKVWQYLSSKLKFEFV